MTILIFTIIIILLLITGTALSLPTIGSQSDDWQKAWAALFCSKQHRSKQAPALAPDTEWVLQTQAAEEADYDWTRRRGADQPGCGANQEEVATFGKHGGVPV